jgi:predicted nucleotidyltransferase
MLARLREAAAGDERIVGLVEYGSGAEGRADAWSDLDVTLFVRDVDFDAFSREWPEALAERVQAVLSAALNDTLRPPS